LGWYFIFIFILDIGGNEDVKQSLKEAVEWQFTHKDQFELFNIRSPKGVLLYGPPGFYKI
jgi:transitional endoplasmic reticulum ATPase